MSDFECPYCGEDQEVNHDDGAGYAEDVAHEHWCRACDKRFVFHTFISLSYEAKAADCLNDGNHDWRPTHTIPKSATRLQCRMCDEARFPSDEEKAAHGIPEHRT